MIGLAGVGGRVDGTVVKACGRVRVGVLTAAFGPAWNEEKREVAVMADGDLVGTGAMGRAVVRAGVDVNARVVGRAGAEVNALEVGRAGVEVKP